MQHKRCSFRIHSFSIKKMYTSVHTFDCRDDPLQYMFIDTSLSNPDYKSNTKKNLRLIRENAMKTGIIAKWHYDQKKKQLLSEKKMEKVIRMKKSVYHSTKCCLNNRIYFSKENPNKNVCSFDLTLQLGVA